MAMKLDRSNSGRSLCVKVVGDLGDVQVTEATSDCDDSVKHKASRTVNTVSNLPPNLVQSSAVPSFGRVAITNSENVQFGNNTYFNGPVTIKQVVHSKSGVDNSSYTRSDDENIISGTDHSTEGKITDKKEQILVWHKITFSAVCITVIGSIIAVVLVLQNKYEPRQQPTKGYTQPDFSISEPSADTPVVGFCHESFQVIIISVILLPLILMLISYSLLTKESIGTRMVNAKKKNTVHENCMDKYCMQCNERGDPLLIAPDHLRIVSRTDWLAQPVEGELDKLVQPVPWVIIAHTATENCYTQSKCVLRVRLIQMFHIESRGWYDIGYNFLVGGDGSVYYGRGWDYQGAHTKGYNKYSIGIAFIGTFTQDSPTKQQVEACEKIISQGVRLGKLSEHYKLFAHRQLMSTASPGDKVFDIIKEWPHFVSNVTDVDSLIPKTS